MAVAVENEGEDPPATILTSSVDQAALHGLLKKKCANWECSDSVNLIEQEIQNKF